MKITRKAMQMIKDYCKESLYHETGGIIGGRDGIADHVAFDEGIKQPRACTYVPDTDFLNKLIEKWDSENIEFMGIFHTHFGGADSLSDEDKFYIRRIMDNMPEYIEELFFPVLTLPDISIRNYRCFRDGDEDILTEDRAEII